jgi:hypothetical protein
MRPRSVIMLLGSFLVPDLPSKQRHLKPGLSLHQRPTRLALRCHLLPTLIATFPTTQLLNYPLPTASACYPPSNPSGNCTDVTTDWYDGNWRASHPGSLEMANFETYMLRNGTIDGCFLNTSIMGTCGQGQVPVVGVDARSVGMFRRWLGLRLSIT